MEVRRLTRADAAAYRALRLRALADHPQAFTSSFEEESAKPLAWSEQRLAADDSRFWGAFMAGALVGMVGLQCAPRAKERHKATVVGMYVAPEASRRGIGSALLRALVEDAQRSGLQLLVLTVTEGNRTALELYVRHGFRSFGVEPGAIRIAGRPFDKNHMYLSLAGQ